MKVGVIGGSGYTGGELLRILLRHPKVEVTYVTSRQHAGKLIYTLHPNLRGLTKLRFEEYSPEKVKELCDLVFLAVPHKASMGIVPSLLEVGVKVIDLSADFRLRDLEAYKKYYGEHTCPELLKKAVYGIPELHREEIRKADLVAGPGCLSSSAILGLAPIVHAGIIDLDHIIIDSKIGSSAAGKEYSFTTHHPERANVVRPYAPSGHRHIAEIEQEMTILAGREVKVGFSAHAVDMVRGILTTIHTFLKEPKTEVDIRKIIIKFYKNEPFIRLLKQKGGVYKLPEPKVLIGSNFCDIGFDLDQHIPRLTIFSAIDNLVKGSAGPAVQSMNIIMGIDETTGLEFPGLYPA
ncbi:MAG: N-acetyl-gamma-glutamyl-phosphate reductase [Candidatus Odinarchaeia archaeon]